MHVATSGTATGTVFQGDLKNMIFNEFLKTYCRHYNRNNPAYLYTN